jgi:hypothetical protein
MKKMENNLLKR